MVPTGMLRDGSLRSPESEMPTSMPVTAGKKTANTTQNETPSPLASPAVGALMSPQPPAKNDTRAATRTARMPNWILSAKSAPTYAITTNASATPVARSCGSRPAMNGTTDIASTKPMM